MSAVAVATWIKEIITAYSAITSFDKHADAARDAVKGEKPYAGSKEALAELKKLDSLAKKLRDIASKGIGEPDKKLELKDLLPMFQKLEGTDKERDEATLKFQLTQLSSAELIDKGKELSAEAKKIADSAGKRRDAAVKIRDQFAKLLETFPDPTGSSIKVMLFESHEAFETASGALASVASAAEDAVKKVDKEVEALSKKHKDMAKTFEEALKTSDKARKAKQKK